MDRKKNLDLTKHFKIRTAQKNTEKHGNSRKFTDKIFLSKSGNFGIPALSSFICDIEK
jgi:hypothetical protein